MDRTRNHPDPARGQAAFIIVMMLAVLTSIGVLVRVTQTSRSGTRQVFNYDGYVRGMAKSGVEEGVRWFAAQVLAPVAANMDPVAYPWPDAAFYPRESTGTAACCTMDEDVGLVQERQVLTDRDLWARFEIRRQKDPATHPYDPYAAHDVTALRYPGRSAGEGLAWQIVARAVVYHRRDAALPYDTPPNEVVARMVMSGEARRVDLNYPFGAAIAIDDFSKVTGIGTIRAPAGAGIAALGGTPSAGGLALETSQPHIVVASSPTVLSLLGIDKEHFRRMSSTLYHGGYNAANGYGEGWGGWEWGLVDYRSYSASPPQFSSGANGVILMEAFHTAGWPTETGSGGYPVTFYGLVIWNSPGLLRLRHTIIKGALVCTAGGSVELASDMGGSGTIVEYSPEMLEKARKGISYVLVGVPVEGLPHEANP